MPARGGALSHGRRPMTARAYYGVIIASSCLAALLFVNTLDADFAYDDSRAIKDNPDLLPSTPLTSVFSNDFWGTPLTHSGSHGSYRPLVVLGFRANYALGGLDPWGYHAANVALHAANTALFAALTAAVTGGRLGTTFTAATLFAAHPVHCEAVAGVVGRAELQAALFALLSLHAYRRYIPARRRAWLLVSLTAATAAMFSKENGVTVLAVCALYDLLGLPASLPISFLHYRKRLQSLKEPFLHLGAAGALLVLVRVQLMGFRAPDFASADNPAADSDSWMTRTLTFHFLPAFNVWLLLCPRILSFDWSMGAIPLLTSPLDPRNLASLALYVALAVLLRRAGSGLPLFALGLATLPFLPASNLLFHVGFVVAERVLYVPSMGLCLLVALGAERLWRQHRQLRPLLALAGLSLLGLMAVRTLRRNLDWRSEEALYRSGIPVNPAKAYGNLGHILSSQGKAAEAEWAYRRALAYRHNMADVHYNLGNLLQEEGRLEEALQSYRAAVGFRPRLAMAYLNMGVVLGSLGRKEESIEALRKCAGLDGSGLKDPRLHESTKISALLHLGRSLAEEERYQEAIEVYLAAVKKLPDHYKQPQALYNMLGEAYYRLEQFSEAEFWYRESLRAKPGHVPSLLTYAKLLSKWDKPSEAEQRFLTARSLAPNDSEVYHHYGQFLAQQSRLAEAADLYVRAAQLAPDHYEVILMAASTLREAGRNLEAERYYHMAARLRPQEVSSHLNLGAMLHLNGKLQEAETSYLEALRLRPGDPTTLDNLHKLRRSVRNHR